MCYLIGQVLLGNTYENTFNHTRANHKIFPWGNLFKHEITTSIPALLLFLQLKKAISAGNEADGIINGNTSFFIVAKYIPSLTDYKCFEPSSMYATRFYIMH